jgi:hypothetical protein
VAFRPNYRQQRSERVRSKQVKAEEKRAALEERVAARKAERDPEPELSAFELSRIYASGWNAGKSFAPDGRDPATEAEALNPYRTDAERARWTEGFVAARSRDPAS